MRTIRFFRSADDVSGAEIENSIAVVADVLRATSTIVTALANGCRKVIPVVKVEEARRTAALLPKTDILLGGERKGKRIDGFDLGNSPQDYTPEVVADKIIVATTTNGTKALVNAGRAKQTVVLSFLNMTTVAEYVLQREEDVTLVAAGIYGRFSQEDAVCCGLLTDSLVAASPEQFSLDDHAARLLTLSRDYKGRVNELMHNCPHGEFLQRIGYESDLDVCAQVDVCQIIPLYADGCVKTIERH